MQGLPFAGEPLVTIVLPAGEPTLGGTLELLELERAGFEAELGAPVAFATSDPGAGPRWLLVLDPEHETPPVTVWEPGADVVVSRARDLEGLFEGLNLWRTARRTRRAARATDCASLDEAADRIETEVADTYPAFELRGLDWQAICARHRERLTEGADPLAAVQALARRARGLPHVGLARPRQPPVRPRGRPAIDRVRARAAGDAGARGRRSAGMASHARRRPRS